MIGLSRRLLLAAAAALGAGAAAAKDNEPISGNRGANILGPRDPPREDQNPDLLRPPSTDHGTIPNLRFSFADAHVKARDGGWSREVTRKRCAPVTRIIISPGRGTSYSLMVASVPTLENASLEPGCRTSEPCVSETTPKGAPALWHLPIMSR